MEIKKFIKQKYPVILIFLTIALIVIFYKPAYKKIDDVVIGKNEIAVEEIKKPRRLLDGVEVETKEEVNPAITAVMVENNIESWPLTGIDKAAVVYEVLAEGRIPRFMTLFPYGTEVEKLGPVRSARPYYLELASPFEAMYMHVGGSPDALAYLKKLPIMDADQFFWSDYYWRSTDRNAPHNVYTSSELISQLYSEREKEITFDFSGWKFSKEKSETAIEYPFDITINYTTSTYQAKYVFNKELGRYQRYQAKEPMELQDGTLIFADTVIVEEHPHVVLDAVGRRDITILGEGRAWVFAHGAVTQGVWKKEKVSDVTRYFTADGNEISLAPGKIWIQIVEKDSFDLTSLESVPQ